MKISRLKRALAGFLSAAMLLTCMPFSGITASAAETAEAHQGSHCEEHSDEWIALTNKNLTKTYTSFTGYVYKWKASGKYYLSEDITNVSEVISIPSGVDVTLCLNGHTLSFIGSKYLSVVGTLDLCDCTATDTAPGGKIITPTGSNNSGAIYMAAGTFNMYGGQLVADSTHGIYNPDGNVNIYGGVIDGGNADRLSGVYFSGGTFNMYGGKICNSNNGIWSISDIAPNISGGVITENETAFIVNSVRPFNVSGTAKISGNTQNVYFMGDEALDISGGLKEGAEIYVNPSKECTIAKNAKPGDEKYFKCDDSSYAVYQEGTNINVAKTVSVTFDANGGSFEDNSATKTIDLPKRLTSAVPEPAREEFIFNGWYTAAADGTKIDESTILSNGQKLYAQWAPAVDTDINKPVTYLGDDVTLEPVAGDTTGTQYEFKNIPEITAAEADKGFKYVYLIKMSRHAQESAENDNNNYKDGKVMRGSTVGGTKDVTANAEGKYIITVDRLSEIQLVKVSPNYTNESSQYYTFAAKNFAAGKVIPVVYFDANGGTLPSDVMDTIETTDGKVSDLPVPSRDNYVFTGWFDADGNKITTETVFAADSIVTAHWEEAKNCVSGLSISFNSYTALNGVDKIIRNPEAPQLIYNYSFKNGGNNIPAKPAAVEEPKFYYVAKGAAFSIDTASEFDGTAKVDSSKYDYYFVQTIKTDSELKIYEAPELINKTLTSKVESFTEDSVTISCKADVLEVVSEITEITIDPDITAKDYKFSSSTPVEPKVSAKAKTLSGKELSVSGYGSFRDGSGNTADTFEADTEYKLSVELFSSDDNRFMFAKGGSTSSADAVLSSELTKAGFKAEFVNDVYMMLTGNVYSYHEHTPVSADNGVEATCTKDGKESDIICGVCGETITEGKVIPALGHDYDENGECTRCGEVRPSVKAAEAIGTALDGLKPTNDTVRSDVQTIVDANKDGTTATVTTFELTPATEDKEGSLKVIVTVSDGENTETVEKTYVIDKLPASPDEGDIIVDTDDNVGGAGVDGAEVKKAVEITAEEQALIDRGEDLHIILNVQNADSTVSAEDKALTESVLSKDMTAGMYLDITLFKKIGTLQTAVTATNTPVTITFAMPESLINTDKNTTREYFIIRVHNGKADILSCTFDPATGKASFKTDRFSSYAIVYRDTADDESEKPEVIVYYPVITSGNVSADRHTAAAGDTVNVRTDFGYDIIVTAANGKTIAKITEKGSFVMPSSKVYVTAVQNETYALIASSWSNSYVYSYDSDMNRIRINSTNKRGVIVVNLGEDYAGKSFTIYSGRKSTALKVTDGKLDSKGRFKFEVPDGKNYTLVVEN